MVGKSHGERVARVGFQATGHDSGYGSRAFSAASVSAAISRLSANPYYEDAGAKSGTDGSGDDLDGAKLAAGPNNYELWFSGGSWSRFRISASTRTAMWVQQLQTQVRIVSKTSVPS